MVNEPSVFKLLWFDCTYWCFLKPTGSVTEMLQCTVDTDQMLPSVPSDQDLHCLFSVNYGSLTEFFMHWAGDVIQQISKQPSEKIISF